MSFSQYSHIKTLYILNKSERTSIYENVTHLEKPSLAIT